MTSKRKDYNFDERFVIEKEEILRRFNEHIEAGVALNVPATGPFSDILIWVYKIILLRKILLWSRYFTDLVLHKGRETEKNMVKCIGTNRITDEEIKSRVETIIPLLGLGETAILERFGTCTHRECY